MDDLLNRLNPYLKGLYSYILPSITFFFMILVASVNGHKAIMHNSIIDFVIRICVSVYFCLAYIGLTKENKLDVERIVEGKTKTEVIFVIFLKISNAFLNGLITFWVLNHFFMYSLVENYIYSTINGMLILFSLITGLPNPKYEL